MMVVAVPAKPIWNMKNAIKKAPAVSGEEEVGRSEPAAHAIAEHEGIAERPEDGGGQTEIGEILRCDVDAVLRADASALQRREPCLHEHDERRRHQDPGNIKCFGRRHDFPQSLDASPAY